MVPLVPRLYEAGDRGLKKEHIKRLKESGKIEIDIYRDKTEADLFNECQRATWYDKTGKEIPYLQYREQYRQSGGPAGFREPQGGFEDWFLDAILWAQLQVKNAVKSATPASDPLGAKLAELANTAEPKPVPADWADIFCKFRRFARIVGSKELLLERAGVFGGNGDDFVREELERHYRESTTDKKREIINKIGDRNITEREEFDRDPRVLNFKNGAFNVVTGEQVTGYRFRTQLGFEFLPNSGTSALWEQCLEQWQPDKETRDGLKKSYAAFFARDSIEFIPIIMFQGEGSNGKTTGLNTLTSMLGPVNCAAISWHDLEKEQWAVAGLDGKYMNIYQDLNEAELKTISRSKILSDRKSLIRAQHKYEKPFNMTYKGGFCYSCNEFPSLPNLGKAIIRRLLVFRFEETFEGEKRNDTLVTKLTAGKEMSKIFNSLLPDLKAIIESGRIGYKQDEAEIIKLWQQYSSSSVEYASNCVERVQEGHATLKDTWNDYLKWCKEAKKKPNSERTLNNNLRQTGFEDYTSRLKGKSTKIWRNLKIKTRAEPAPAQKTL